jgi:hypoxanthine phosphoribosyltransferase
MNILVVDDINDTGATFNWIMEDWESGSSPSDEKWRQVWGNNVRFAVVVDNLSSKCNVKMNYFGMEVNKAEEDVWIEFPYEEWWTKP